MSSRRAYLVRGWHAHSLRSRAVSSRRPWLASGPTVAPSAPARRAPTLGHAGAGPLPGRARRRSRDAGRAHVLAARAARRRSRAPTSRRPGLPLLLVNGRQALSRQRFTLAHEFGHHRMGHATVVDEQAAISGKLTHDRNEVCANAFAAEFLLPRDAVAAWASRARPRRRDARGRACCSRTSTASARRRRATRSRPRACCATAGAPASSTTRSRTSMHLELARWLGPAAARRRAGRRRGDAAAHPDRAARQRARRLPRGRGRRRGAGAADRVPSRRGARDARPVSGSTGWCRRAAERQERPAQVDDPGMASRLLRVLAARPWRSSWRSRRRSRSPRSGPGPTARASRRRCSRNSAPASARRAVSSGRPAPPAGSTRTDSRRATGAESRAPLHLLQRHRARWIADERSAWQAAPAPGGVRVSGR